MKVSGISYYNKSNKKQNFGNFIRAEIPLNINDINKISVDAILQRVKEAANAINVLTQGKLKVYRRSLDDMDFVDRFYKKDNQVARFIYIDDAESKNQPEFSAVKKYLNDNGFKCIEFPGKFLEKSKGLFRPSKLCKAAYYAKPDQMIIL